MTRRPALRLCLLTVTALCAASCAGQGGGAAESSSGAQTATRTTTHTGGSTGGTRPGAPYDIEAFENEGGQLDGFRASYRADSGCRTPPDERCHVVEVISGSDDDPSRCRVVTISYDPPSEPPTWPQGGPRPKIQEGTTVTATVLCPGAAGYDDGSGSDTSSDTSSDSSSDSSSPATDTATDTGSPST